STVPPISKRSPSIQEVSPESSPPVRSRVNMPGRNESSSTTTELTSTDASSGSEVPLMLTAKAGRSLSVVWSAIRASPQLGNGQPGAHHQAPRVVDAVGVGDQAPLRRVA